MSLLDGDLAQSIYDGFQGKLLSGEVRRKIRPSSGANDAHGDPIELDTMTWNVEGFYETFSRFLRAQAGIPDGTVKCCIFAKSAPDWSPHESDYVRLGTQWVSLTGNPSDIDPANALWVLDAVQTEAPL